MTDSTDSPDKSASAARLQVKATTTTTSPEPMIAGNLGAPAAPFPSEVSPVAEGAPAAPQIPSLTSGRTDREVIGLFGLPIDISDMAVVFDRVHRSIDSRSPFFLSTVNVNFLVASRTDPEFRTSLITSDLCTVDGTPIIWIARLLGVRIKQRVAGSDLFEQMKGSSRRPPTSVFLFGGEEGIGELAAQALNSQDLGLRCAGFYYPGFGSLEDMSAPEILETVNASKADLLAVALGAKKGQAWIYRNSNRLTVPVRVHLGATINFQAGTIKRAPALWQEHGIEWLWRIFQEPKLWSRYAKDALVLGRLMLSRVLPLAMILARQRRGSAATAPLSIERAETQEQVTIYLAGPGTDAHARRVELALHEASEMRKTIRLDLAEMNTIDLRFLGMLVVARTALSERGCVLEFENVPAAVARIIRLSDFGWLLN